MPLFRTVTRQRLTSSKSWYTHTHSHGCVSGVGLNISRSVILDGFAFVVAASWVFPFGVPEPLDGCTVSAVSDVLA